MERLYIDDVLVDVGKDTNITLSLVSNLFSDISKMSGNASYTIKLPRTAKNSAVFMYSDRVDSRSTMAYIMHKARFYRNGVEIFRDADCTLQSASADGFEVVIVWGCRSKFNTIKDKGLGLRDIESNAAIEFEREPDRSTSSDFESDGYGYLMLDPVWIDKDSDDWQGHNEWGSWSGNYDKFRHWAEAVSGEQEVNRVRLFTAREFNHPCVSVPWVLDRIQETTGVEFRWSGEAKTLIDSLVIPCVTKTANELTYSGEKLAAVLTGFPYYYAIEKWPLAVVSNDNVFGNISGTVDTLTVHTSCELMITAQVTIRHKYSDVYNLGLVRFDMYFRYHFRGTKIVINVKHENGDVDKYRIGNAEWYFIDPPEWYFTGEQHDDNSGFLEKLTSRGIITVEEGDTIYVTLDGSGYSTNIQFDCEGGFTAVAVDGGDVPYSGMFPIVENLPDIKIIDFVKFLCAITGTFPIQKSAADVVEFAAYGIITENLNRAVDWSKRLRARSRSNVPMKMTYRIGDWCRHNHYKWRVDSLTHGKYDGELYVSDETIGESRDVMTFPFAASDNLGSNVAIVPMYERKLTYDEDGYVIEDPEEIEYEYSKCEPRILQRNGIQTFFGLNMQSIIAEKYGLIIGCLSNAKIIEEEVELTDREISEFDETVPVWLAQYGAYFAVLEIKAGSDGIATVKMIKIKKDEIDETPQDETVYYSVTANLTRVSASYPSQVRKNGSLIVTLVPDDNCTMGTVTVKMGGVTQSGAYNSSTGVVRIDSVTGNVVITASATVSMYNVTKVLDPGVTLNTPDRVARNASVEWTVLLDTGYGIDRIVVTMGGNDITSSAWNGTTKKITIAAVTGDINIQVYASALGYPVITHLTHITYIGPNMATSGEPYNALLKPQSGRTITSVQVLMDDLRGNPTDITLSAFNRNSNKIYIASVTGTIEITAAAT